MVFMRRLDPRIQRLRSSPALVARMIGMGESLTARPSCTTVRAGPYTAVRWRFVRRSGRGLADHWRRRRLLDRARRAMRRSQ